MGSQSMQGLFGDKGEAEVEARCSADRQNPTALSFDGHFTTTRCLCTVYIYMCVVQLVCIGLPSNLGVCHSLCLCGRALFHGAQAYVLVHPNKTIFQLGCHATMRCPIKHVQILWH